MTASLRTSGNAISFWKCASGSDQEIEHVVLVSGYQRLTLDIALIDSERVVEAGLQLEETKDETPVARLVDRHVDIARLDFVRLDAVARLIRASVGGAGFRRLRKRELLDVLVRGVRYSEFNDDVRAELEKALGEGK